MKPILSFYEIFLITLQGLPAAITPDGISLVTTLPAPITELSPILTPGIIHALPPIQTLFPILIDTVFSIDFSQASQFSPYQGGG